MNEGGENTPTLLASTSAQEFAPRSGIRKSIAYTNDDGGILLYCKRERFGLTVTSTDYDFILSPRQTRGYVSTLDGKPQIQERVTMIAASGTPRVSYDETEDEQR